MVKVTAPALSLDASGSVAGTMVFSKWKGRNYVRSLVKPKNPRSGAQTGVRAMFAFLSQIWAGILAAHQNTWQDRADAGTFSLFNAFMQGNALRWRNYLTPSKATPAAELESVDDPTIASATPGVRQVTVSVSLSGAGAGTWGVILYRGLASDFVAGLTNAIQVRPHVGGEAMFVDTPLLPRDYWYRAQAFTADGVQGVATAATRATVV